MMAASPGLAAPSGPSMRMKPAVSSGRIRRKQLRRPCVFWCPGSALSPRRRQSKHHGSAPGGKARFGPGPILGLFLVFAVGEARIMIVLTLAFAVIATIVHVKIGRRDRIDTLIDRGP